MAVSPENLSQRIDQGAEQCVKCGLCLPHCPTYQVAQNENESPRGRIALMQGAIRQQVPVTEKLKYHLDTCLACRACEAVCPAHVPYEELITSTRAWLNIKRLQKPLWRERALIFIFSRPFLCKILGKVFGLRAKKSWYSSNKTLPQTKGKVLLLPSCANTAFDPQLARDAEYLLTSLGWQVKLPTSTNCCGALALHAGKLTEAQQCAQQHMTQWQDENPDFILTLTNGCHATMQEYAHPPFNLTPPNIPLMTIEEFLLQEINSQNLTFAPSNERVIVHTPCTLRNAIRKPGITIQLLQKIPGITYVELPVSVAGCCGAAGSYFLRHQEIAEQLVSPIVEFTRQQHVTAFITTNIGCAMHVQRALQDAKMSIPLLHPVSLIAKSLIN